MPGPARKTKSKKSGESSLGRLIVKRKHKDRLQKKSDGTGFHVADLAQSSHPLQSVTEMSSLEDFVTNAVLAEREFMAERANVSFVGESDGANSTAARRATAQPGKPAAAAAAEATREQLQIPRRPAWTDDMPAEELHRREKEAFLAWRRAIAKVELERGGGITNDSPGMEATVTPFEKNIEVGPLSLLLSGV